jgi:hypothetical protein
LFSIPADWAAANGLGAKTMAFTSTAGAGSAGLAYGCNAHAWEPFDPTTKPPDGYADSDGSIPIKSLIYHDLTHKQARNTRYKYCEKIDSTNQACSLGTTVAQGYPEWGSQQASAAVVDAISGAAFVRTSSRAGLLFTGQMAMAPSWTPTEAEAHLDADGDPHVGYSSWDTSGVVPNKYCCHSLYDPYWGARGPYSTFRNAVMWSYSLDRFPSVIAGVTSRYDVEPDTDAYEFGQIDPYFRKHFSTGALRRTTFHAPTNRLFNQIGPDMKLDNPVGAFYWPIICVWGVT